MNSAATSNQSPINLNYRTIDLVTIATLSVAFGVVFWGWGKFYGLVTTGALFAFPPTVGILGGAWLIAGVVGGLIIRKPGAALVTEILAALVSALLPGNEWGWGVLMSGLVQGLGAELILAVFVYRQFNVVVAVLAGAAAGAFGAVYEWFVYFSAWSFGYQLAYLGFFVVSGAVIAGVGGWVLVRALAKAGVLDSFEAGREASVDV